MNRILVIDGNSIINRAFYGVRPLTTKAGKNTNAIYGMLNMICRQLDDVNPDYAAIAFDVHEPTFRHKMFDGYKAGRNPTPPELLEQFDDAKEIMRMLGLHVLELPGYEADDIQGTVAKMAHGVGDTESFIYSGDRDLYQLIDDRVTVLFASNKDTLLMGRKEFFDEYGVKPEQFVDVKALMGDPSDKIPGVSGIGPKNALSLIRKFGSLDGVYENIDDKDIGKSVRAHLIEDREKAYLSQTLARIVTDAPIGCSLEELRRAPIDRAGLYRKFNELELHQFLTKFRLSAADLTAEKSADAPKNTLNFATRGVSSEEILSLSAERIAISPREGGYAFSVSDEDLLFDGGVSELAPLFARKLDLVCFGGKKLWHELTDAGIRIGDEVRFLDLSLYLYVLNPGSGDSTVASAASMFLSETVDENSSSAALLLRLEEVLRKKIDEIGGGRVLDLLEIPLLPILAETERRGFMIDREGMREFGEALGALAEDLQARIFAEAGESFNLNSPKQLGEVLYLKLGLPNPKKGKMPTDAETLEELRPYSPIIDDILEFRQVTKLRSTYTAVLPEVADHDARVHTDFKQTMTATGRLSSADPNLQNIPIRTKMGREMRRFFVAKEGCVLVDADYSQIELRLLAHISGDYNMIEAFRDGEDIHRKTAAAVFHVPEEEVTEELRKRAKAVNFGIIYGISNFSLAKDIGTTKRDAQAYIESYLLNYPMIDAYLTDVVEKAREDGYTTTPMGRRRYIPELTSANKLRYAFGKRVAMNAPIQGAAADVMKLAMIRVSDRLKAEGLDAGIVMQVHDELVVEVKENDAARCAAIVKEEMENAVTLSLPLIVEVTTGKNWLEQS